MKKLNLAIIGQGRSGKDIHGFYYLSERNKYFNVKYVVDEDEYRRKVSLERYAGCEVFADYRELFDKKDIDLVVNATYSHLHFPVTKDLLEHGFNVLCEKPFARNRYECDVVTKIARDKGLVLAAFQQTFFAPFYQKAIQVVEDKLIGDPVQVSIRYNGFSRRWDWQTLQKKMAGSTYNTGPHPVGMALGFLGFDEELKVAFSRLVSSPLTSGDSDDYCKAVFVAPNKPVVDVEISAMDGYNDGYTLKIQGTRGTFKCTAAGYDMKYIVDGENPVREVVEGFLEDANKNPDYCHEKLITHEESGKFDGTAFDVGTASLYENLYYVITEGKELIIDMPKVRKIVSVTEQIYAANPMEVNF